MRILYGVQGTGNGHITRARVMSSALRKTGIEVDYLFSGRPAERYFNMEPFGDYRIRQGLTLITREGRVSIAATLVRNNLLRLWRDARALDLSGYDLVLNDFEPVTAWAARLKNVPSLGIAHQYAFCYPVPGTVPWLKTALRAFAPVERAVGVHWHHFDAPILPPLIEPQSNPLSTVPGQILVYLPFEAMEDVRDAFRGFPDHRFLVYAAVDKPVSDRNLVIKPFSRDGFQADLAGCDGVICNAGFGLCSEAIQSGKKLLVKPLGRQVEQSANAEALRVLRRAEVIHTLHPDAIGAWLKHDNPEPLVWPDTASALVDWIAAGCQEPVERLAQRLWQGVPSALQPVIS